MSIKEFCDICQKEVIGKDRELNWSTVFRQGIDDGVVHYRLKMQLYEKYDSQDEEHAYCCKECIVGFVKDKSN